MNGNLYINGFAGGFGELLGSLFIGSIIMSFGLKTTIAASFTSMVITVLMFLFPIVSWPLYYAGVLCAMKFSLSCAFASIFTGTNSYFREDLVAIIFAICNLFSRFFTIFAPLIASTNG